MVAQAADAGNPVPPLVRALQAGGRASATAGAVHVGATSQDVLDTALVLLARRAIAAIDADLAAAAERAAALAERAPRRRRHGPHADAAGAADDLRAQGGRLAGRRWTAPAPGCAPSSPPCRCSTAAPWARWPPVPGAGRRRCGRRSPRSSAWPTTAAPWHTVRLPIADLAGALGRGRRAWSPPSRSTSCCMAQTEVGRGRRGQRGPRRLLGDAAQEQPGRGHLRPGLRPPGTRAGRHAVRRDGAGARAGRRGLAQRVADPHRAAHHRRLGGLVAGREPGRRCGWTPRGWPRPWPRRDEPQLAAAARRGARRRRWAAARRTRPRPRPSAERRTEPAGRWPTCCATGPTSTSTRLLAPPRPTSARPAPQVDAVLADHERSPRGAPVTAVEVVVHRGRAGRTRRSSSSPTPWAPPAGCGTRRCRRWPSATGWSPTTPAGTASRPAPAGPYTLDDLVDDVGGAARPGRRRAGAPRRAVAGRDDRPCGWRPGSRSGSHRLALLCTSAYDGRRSRLTASAPPRSAREGTAPLAPAVVGRWLTPGVRRRAPRRGRPAGGDGRRGGRRGLRRLLRGRRATGPARGPGADHRPHARRLRCRGPRPAAGAPAGDRRGHPRRAS